ncbi:MAG: hypothetical protein AAF223_07570, partial [Bacteroidota bacterium]
LWHHTPKETLSVTKASSTEQKLIKKETVIEKKTVLNSPVGSVASQPITLESETINETTKQPKISALAHENNKEKGLDNFTLAELQTSSEAWMNASSISYLSRKAVRQNPIEPIIPSLLLPTVADTTKVYPADQKKAHLPNTQWRIGVGISPDVSAINLGEASQVGSQAKVGIEYFFFPRLSVQTGVIFSNKVYTANGESYKPSPGYWKKYRIPNSIDAQCDVLDISINLRYYAINLPRSRVFVSGGLSSYLMLTEDYVYQYRKVNGKKPYNYEHQERNKNQHYFKVANVSLGYEQLLSKRWALQVEPFVKIPVAGVGFGKIKLATTGMFVSLNYQLR